MLKRLINLVISFWFYVFYWLWEWINRIFGNEIAGSCVVLLYHQVASENRKRFKKQMKILRHLAEPISANNTKPLEKDTHYAAVTFDDGFTCILENAVPELQALKIPLTFFVPTGYLGCHQGWIHDANDQHYPEFVVDSDQLQALNDELITIGSHGVNHTRLSDISEDDAKKELSESKHSLESIINKPIELFAFPHGAYTPTLVNTALQIGYKRVFTVLPKLAFSDPNEVVTGRIDVSPNDWLIEFILKLLGAYRWLPIAFLVKRKIINLCNHISSFFRNEEIAKAASHKIIK
jgi:peptidoglycan/xylan/chitin deacetylase (PgdA/CDA1 family)